MVLNIRKAFFFLVIFSSACAEANTSHWEVHLGGWSYHQAPIQEPNRTALQASVVINAANAVKEGWKPPLISSAYNNINYAEIPGWNESHDMLGLVYEDKYFIGGMIFKDSYGQNAIGLGAGKRYKFFKRKGIIASASIGVGAQYRTIGIMSTLRPGTGELKYIVQPSGVQLTTWVDGEEEIKMVQDWVFSPLPSLRVNTKRAGVEMYFFPKMRGIDTNTLVANFFFKI